MKLIDMVSRINDICEYSHLISDLLRALSTDIYKLFLK